VPEVNAYCTVVQDDKRGNGALLCCARTGSVIDRLRMETRLTDSISAITAEASRIWPGRRVDLYIL
jgi:hypothetical protein